MKQSLIAYFYSDKSTINSRMFYIFNFIGELFRINSKNNTITFSKKYFFQRSIHVLRFPIHYLEKPYFSPLIAFPFQI